MEDDVLTKLPPGYRFKPTEEELITHYLMKKVSYEPLPSQVIPEIDDTHLHSKPPSNLVRFSCGEREWYFFVHGGVDLVEEHKESKHGFIRIVGDGNGFWKANGEEQPIRNSGGEVFAFKICFTYFSGCFPSDARKTHWKMDKYRLPHQCHNAASSSNFQGEEWVLGKLIRGEEYTSYF